MVSGRVAVPWAGVLFDLDGTLADTVPLILACYHHTMRTHFGRELPEERWLRSIGRPLRDSLADFADERHDVAALMETYVAYQRREHDGRVRPFEGAGAAVAAAVEAGARVGVVTSKRREMALRTLESCGLGGRVETLVAADDVERGKPDPEPVRKALDALGLVGRERAVLFVGDSPFDLQAGRAAGVRVAAVTWGPFARDALEAEAPDRIVEGLAELAELIRAGPESLGRSSRS